MKEKFINSTSKKMILFIAIISFIFLNMYIGIKFYIKSSYQDKFIRLHVFANSDSISDQIIKLKVDEKLNNYIKNLNLDSNLSKSEILNILSEKTNEISNFTDNILHDNNVNYSSKIKIGKIKYDEKNNILYNMPSGSYDSIDIILGDGNGKNIWSIIFPNKENIDKIKYYEGILPGISNIYGDNNLDDDKSYSFKIVDIFNEIF